MRVNNLVDEFRNFLVSNLDLKLRIWQRFDHNSFNDYMVVFAHRLGKNTKFTDKKRVDSTLTDFVLQENFNVFFRCPVDKNSPCGNG